MKLFGKIVLAAVAVTSVIAFSSCSQPENPVAAYQYTNDDGATLVFYGNEEKGKFTVSTKEEKFKGDDSIDTTIYFLDKEGKRLPEKDADGNDNPDRSVEAKTEVTVPSYAILKGDYEFVTDDNGGKSLNLTNVEEFKLTETDWAAALAAKKDIAEFEYSGDKAALTKDAKNPKKDYITGEDLDGDTPSYILKKTISVAEFGAYETADDVSIDTFDVESIKIGDYTFTEVL
jgi:hypothetical protein